MSANEGTAGSEGREDATRTAVTADDAVQLILDELLRVAKHHRRHAAELDSAERGVRASLQPEA